MHVSKGYFLFNLTKHFFGYPNNSQAQANKTANDVILIVVIHNLTKELRTGDLMDKNLEF